MVEVKENWLISIAQLGRCSSLQRLKQIEIAQYVRDTGELDVSLIYSSGLKYFFFYHELSAKVFKHVFEIPIFLFKGNYCVGHC